jgi:hypothetical protein
MNSKNIDTKLTDLIRQTDDIQFLGIYKEFLSFRRKHFVEFFLLKKISFINNLIECIEEEMDVREQIEEMASEKTEEILPEEKEEQNWKKEWKKQNESENVPTMKNDFKKIVLYVGAFHVCIFSFFIIQSVFKEENINQKRLQNMEEVMYPNPNKTKGPISDSIGKRN